MLNYLETCVWFKVLLNFCLQACSGTFLCLGKYVRSSPVEVSAQVRADPYAVFLALVLL
jgi:hypothetical protein